MGPKKHDITRAVDKMFDTILAKQKRRRKVCLTKQLKGRLREVKVDMDIMNERWKEKDAIKLN